MYTEVLHKVLQILNETLKKFSIGGKPELRMLILLTSQVSLFTETSEKESEITSLSKKVIEKQ